MNSSDPKTERDIALTIFQGRLGYYFSNPDTLDRALTHSSKGIENYERLEFLGDRVLGLVIAEILYRCFPFEKEGSLARRHSALACTETLAKIARDLDVPGIVKASSAELASGGNKQDNLLADCMEAIIGAIFIDKGYVPCQEVITSLWGDRIYTLSQPPVDSKTALQEWAQARGLPIPQYEIVERSGPDHAPQFKIRVTLQGIEPKEATAGTRRTAEKQVAEIMLDSLQDKK
jgi:ribonuclease III